MSIKIEKQKKRFLNKENRSSYLEETMFVGSIFLQDVPKKTRSTSLIDGTSFGINQFWLNKG